MAVTPDGFRVGKDSATHLVRKVPRGTQDHVSELSVLFDERRHKRVEEPEGVIADQHLTITIRSRADADRRNTQPGSYGLGDGIWNRLEYDRKCSRVLEGECVEHQFLGCVLLACLLPHSSEAMHMLWRQPDVSHDGEASRREPFHRVREGAPTFDLNGRSAAFLKKSRCIPHRLFDRDLIG